MARENGPTIIFISCIHPLSSPPSAFPFQKNIFWAMGLNFENTCIYEILRCVSAKTINMPPWRILDWYSFFACIKSAGISRLLGSKISVAVLVLTRLCHAQCAVCSAQLPNRWSVPIADASLIKAGTQYGVRSTILSAQYPVFSLCQNRMWKMYKMHNMKHKMYNICGRYWFKKLTSNK